MIQDFFLNIMLIVAYSTISGTVAYILADGEDNVFFRLLYGLFALLIGWIIFPTIVANILFKLFKKLEDED